MNMIYIFIIITILLIMPVEIIFRRDEDHNDIDIYLTKIFNLRLDFDEFLKLLVTTKENRDKVTIAGLKSNYELFKLSRRLIYDVTKNSRPKEVELRVKAKKIYPEIDLFVYVVLHNLLLLIRGEIRSFVPRQKNEVYEIKEGDKFAYTFRWSIRIRMAYILFSLIRNYKDIIKIRKFVRKGKKKYGTSSNL